MHKHTLHNGQLTLIHADCLVYLKRLSDNSVDLILTDPPYFRVKTNAWDNQWPDVESYLAWLDEVLMEFWRVLKPNGSVYLFCGSSLAADTEILVRTRFELFNHIIWANSEYDTLKQTYSELVKEYDELKTHYDALRRPFAVTSDVPYTDVWHFEPVQYYPGKHPCEKPAALLEHVIKTSSREGSVVLDAFMGSGSTGKACLALNRQFIGIEFEEETFETTLNKLKG